MSDVRFKYCNSLGYDILALTELWENAPTYADGSVRWTFSQKQIDPKTDLPIYPNDPAAGVGILLSKRMVPKYRGHGSPCNRICWVRLKGPVTNLFVIAVYLPHRARVKPAQEDTLLKLIKLLKEVPKNDCIIILGDLNEQLGIIPGFLGNWAHGTASRNAQKVVDVMRMFDLQAANT